MAAAGPGPGSGYGAREAARLLGVGEARVRAWARAGLAGARPGPGGALRLSFQDLLLLRTARDLSAAGVPPRRLRRALAALRARLGAGQALASLRLTAQGGKLVAGDGRGEFHPETGQALLALSDPREARPRPAGAPPRAPLAPDANAWARWGEGLAGRSPAQASAAFARALALVPDHPRAHLGLGRLLLGAGDAAAAEGHLALALEARPGDPPTLVELGAAQEALGRDGEALLSYARALAAAPGFARAHAAAARVLSRLGREGDALRHRRAAGGEAEPPGGQAPGPGPAPAPGGAGR